MFALAAGVAQFGDRRRRIGEQPLAVVGIDPGAGNDAGAVARADLLLIGLDQQIERRRIDVALLGQQRLQRAHAQVGFRQFGMVVIVVVVVVIVSAHGRKDNRRHRGDVEADFRSGVVPVRRSDCQKS